MRSSLVVALTLLSLFGHATALRAAETAAQVEGSQQTVRLQTTKQGLLLHVNDAAKAVGWEVKIITPGKLLTLCRKGPAGVCVPLRLDKLRFTGMGKDLFVEAAALEKALSLSTVKSGDGYRLQPVKSTTSPESEIPAYNAAWGPGRGFREGQTLPDIPLYDMQGNEVRFSKYLGKQYILYCWSSW